MTNPLFGKLAFVTGAAGPIGWAICEVLAEDGCTVIAADIDGKKLDTLTAEHGGKITPLEMDVSNAKSVSSACAQIKKDHGDVDILVNNAGVLSNHKSADTDPEEWRRVMSINLDGSFFLAREWLAGMKKNGWGRIINMCSLAMKVGGITAGTSYTVSKGGLASLTFSLAREAAASGVTVNAVAPAYVMTPMVSEQLSDAQRAELLLNIPVGRFCEPEEVAHSVRFLASPLSGFITGEVIDINGGLHMD